MQRKKKHLRYLPMKSIDFHLGANRSLINEKILLERDVLITVLSTSIFIHLKARIKHINQFCIDKTNYIISLE